MASFPTPFPDPSKGLLLGDIFSGIGGWELAAGCDWQSVFAAEMEPNARTVFEANHGRQPDVGDILECCTSSTKIRARLLRILSVPEQLASWAPPRALRSTRGQSAAEGS